MRLRRRIEHLERLRPPPAPDDGQGWERKRRVLRRWVQLVDVAVPLVPDQQRGRVQEALEQLRADYGGPYRTWLIDLCDGCCRLPELAPAVMKDLLLAWLSPDADGAVVCKACGLEYPHHRPSPQNASRVLPGRSPVEGAPPWYDVPEFFESCPHCGASRHEMDWPHLVPMHDHPWKRLDGYAGEPDGRAR
jgi:rubredoxin